VTLYKAVGTVQVWSGLGTGKRDTLDSGEVVDILWTKSGYGYITSPTVGYVDMRYMAVVLITTPPPEPAFGVPVTNISSEINDSFHAASWGVKPGWHMAEAIDANDAQALGLPFCGGTYANIRFYIKPDTKDGNITLIPDEVARVKYILRNDARKWNWVCGQEHTRFIYMDDGTGKISITNESGFYSGLGVSNFFNVLQVVGQWVQVETLKAGSDWWTRDVPKQFLHRVWSLTPDNKIIDNPCGEVWLPLISRNGAAWIQKSQLYA
jgi:hypothetical protein